MWSAGRKNGLKVIIFRDGVSPNGDASTILTYIATLVSVAQFDALAPYHPSSEGVLAKLMKRPYHERTMENKNVAAIYAGGKLLMKLVPNQASLLRQMFWKLKLDPDDNQVSLRTNCFHPIFSSKIGLFWLFLTSLSFLFYSI